jgi:dynein intermediate chain, cytosolic
VWDVDQLQQPLEMLDLRISMSIVSNYASANISTDKKMEASVTAFAVHRKENRQLYIGTEAGKLYSTPLDAQKSKTTSSVTATATDASSSLSLGGVDALAIDKSILPRSASAAANIAAREVVVTAFSKENTHFGPVTSMHLNPLLPVHRDGLLLTSSLDSTVKLWSTEHPHSPVFSFEPSTEYVCDVRWSPTHPALFAVVDGAGAISFWNIIKDIEVPALEAKIADKALNKVRWTSDGKSVIVGDASGCTIVYEVPAEVREWASHSLRERSVYSPPPSGLVGRTTVGGRLVSAGKQSGIGSAGWRTGQVLKVMDCKALG